MRPKHMTEALKLLFGAGKPVLIKGAPGVGKTDIVKQVCKDLDMDLIVTHPVVSDPVDFKGLPFVVEDNAEFLPIGELRSLLHAEKPTVFFMDDLGQAPPAVQAAAMQLILARHINGHKVSDHVVFCAATNRKEDRAGVSGILEPVKSRFASILELTVEKDDWIGWALDNEMPEELIGFIQWKPSLLHDFKPTSDITNTPCPRTVAYVGAMRKLGVPRELEFEIYGGAAGEGFAAEFTGFLRVYESLPDPDLALEQPDKVDIPEDPATQFAFSGAISHRATKKNMANFIKLSERMPADFTVMTILTAIRRDADLQEHKPFIEWLQRNSDVVLGT